MVFSGDSRVPRVGVIGLGSMGRNHARVYYEMNNVDLVAVADIDEATLKSTANRFRAHPYSEYIKMLDQEKLDLVSIAVPTSKHSQVARDVIDRGVNLLIEKPLASTVDEGERIISLAEKQGVSLGVGHIERFNPVIIAMKEKLVGGILGRLFQITIRRSGPFPERIRDTGVLLDLAIHDTDLMYYFVGSEVNRFSSESAQFIHELHEDMAVSLLAYANGVIGVLIENWLSPTKIRDVTINGEQGTMVADLLTQDLYFYENNYTASKWESLAAFRGISEGNMTRFHIPRREPLGLELEAFVQSVVNNEPFAVNGQDGLRSLRTVQKLIDCSYANKKENY